MESYSIAHAYVYGRVRQNIKGNIADRKKILEILRFIIRIPGPHQLEFLKEMESAGFFKRLSRDKFESKTSEDKPDKKEVKEIDKVLTCIEKLPDPFRQKFIDCMIASNYIILKEPGKYEILRKNIRIPKDFYGSPLWD